MGEGLEVVCDLTATSLIVLAVTGFIMWLKLRNTRRWGLIALEAGAVIFLFIVWTLAKFNF